MKTAVEYFIEQLKRIGFSTNNILEFENEIQIAKEMFEEQIEEAYYNGKGNGMDISHPLSITKEISAEQYYNDTFKSTKWDKTTAISHGRNSV
jgi:DNA-binding transcriptional regulator YhcF (GntR family)